MERRLSPVLTVLIHVEVVIAPLEYQPDQDGGVVAELLVDRGCCFVGDREPGVKVVNVAPEFVGFGPSGECSFEPLLCVSFRPNRGAS